MTIEDRPSAAVWECAKEAMTGEALRILRNRADAEDAVMDAMERIVKNEAKFFPLSRNERVALAVIYVRNTAINLYNANRKRPLPVDELPEGPDPSASPEETAVSEDAAERLLSLIERMPPVYRDPLILAAKYEMTVREIAAVLGIRKGTVRTRLSRARSWLREHERSGL
ncbi:MAG: sigma-70 family RNA polymerase sigma factor [Clostridia bacterium]|nr:sigma-70 family RNA polymerase sigma factor [Clostridia bacterium]